MFIHNEWDKNKINFMKPYDFHYFVCKTLIDFFLLHFMIKRSMPYLLTKTMYKEYQSSWVPSKLLAINILETIFWKHSQIYKSIFVTFAYKYRMKENLTQVSNARTGNTARSKSTRVSDFQLSPFKNLPRENLQGKMIHRKIV